MIGCGYDCKKAECLDIPKTLEETLTSDEKYFSVPYPQICTLEEQNKFVYNVMYDSYFFADKLSLDTNFNEYVTHETGELLDTLKYKEDRYSFFMDAETLLKFFQEGKNENFGLNFFYAPVGGESFYYLIVSYVYPNSPAHKAGIKRGDMITTINTLPIYDVQEAFTMFSNENTLSLKLANYTEENTRTVTISQAEYSINTVLDARVLTQNEKKIGYMVFQDFITQAESELDYYFQVFQEKNVTELVLDLRYNSGGDTSIANHLATLIGGENVYGKVFDEIHFNDKYASYNYKEYFKNYNDSALNLRRVFIITTQATASSSELVINSLKASNNNIDVIQVGDTTYGKPYAFLPALFCDQALLVVNVESKNSDGEGAFTLGIEPTCDANDDLFKTFGDPEEASLSEALYYIANNQCKPKESSLNKHNNRRVYPFERQGFRQIMSAF